MKDYDIFASAFLEYLLECKNSTKEGKDKLLEDLFLKIKDLDCNDFRMFYIKSQYLWSNNQFKEAKDNIDKAIYLVNHINKYGIPENTVFFIIKDNEGVYRSYDYIKPIRKQISDVYHLAGILYAKIGDETNSLKYYKISLYYNSFLKSEFDDKDSVNVFSFRRYNEHSLSDLINNTITVSPSSMMNDPFDSIINLWANTENLKKTSIDPLQITPMCSAFSHYRIRSFSLGKGNSPTKSILMWSHYACEHVGFCVKYKLSRHFIKQEENENYEHMYLKKIKYKNNKINISISRIDTDLAFATKKIDWKYENEVRLIVYNPNRTEQFYGIELDKESEIEAIFFGYRCPDSTINTIKNIFLNKKEKTPKFYKMILDENDVYNLKYQTI